MSSSSQDWNPSAKNASPPWAKGRASADVWFVVKPRGLGLGLGFDRSSDRSGASALSTGLHSLGQILAFALSGAAPDPSGSLAKLRARRVPTPVIELLELMFARAGEGPALLPPP